MAPPPVLIQGNNWREIRMPDRDEFIPHEKVTVIIPYYNAPDKLPVVLKALEYQTYPKELTEIIISADYPDHTLPFEYLPGNARVIRQPHDGFGAGRARNAGANAASGSILVFFDGDIVPSPRCVEAHARWHHRASNLLTIGDRGFVEPGAIKADQIPQILHDLINGVSDILVEPSHHKNLIDLTDELTRGGDVVYQAVIGHNFAIRRNSYLELGGVREDSLHWGLEDTEFGYRAYTRGMIIIFVSEAYTWHLGDQDYQRDPDKMHGLHMQSALMEQYIADYRYRNATPGRSFIVPEHIVNISSPDPLLAMEIAFDVLADPPHDLIVRVDLGKDHDDRVVMAQRRLSGDPRVRFGPSGTSLTEFPDSPMHVYIRTNRMTKRKLIKLLKRSMGRYSVFKAESGVDCGINLMRSWVVHRSNQCVRQRWNITATKTAPINKFVIKQTARESRMSASSWYRIWMLLGSINTLGDAKRAITHRMRIVRSKSC